MNHLKAMAIAGSFLMLFSAGDAQAQLCGYGTSRQDCDNQNRDAQARSEAEQENRRQMEAQSDASSSGDGYTSPGSSGPPRKAYGYVAVAWHGDAADVWATWNRSSEEEATMVALTACRRAMGEGCEIALSAWNSTIAIAKAPDGGLRVGWGAKPQEAEAQAIGKCSGYLDGCSIQHRFTGKPWSVADDYLPRDVPRVTYAMFAWPKGRPAPIWLNKVWIATGQGGYERTSKLLLERCKMDTGGDCEIAQYAKAETGQRSGGVIASYFNPKRGTMWFASASPREAKVAMERHCRDDGTVCENLQVYDASTRRLQVLDQAVPR